MERVLTDEAIAELLNDDAPYGDLTTSLLVTERPINIEFSARYDMTLCGVEEAARMFKLKAAIVDVSHYSGETVKAGTPILHAEGPSSVLFMVWKAAQVLVEWMSGIATAAKTMVDGAAGLPIACTRKQAPGTKALSVKAIRCGGAVMHRLGLSESILVFAEHRQFIELAPEQVVARLRARAPEHKSVFEAHNLDDALLWARAGVDVLQLDKFSPEEIRTCKNALEQEHLATYLAAAGGVNMGNVSEYADSGADLLVTSAPYYAKPKDVQVDFK